MNNIDDLDICTKALFPVLSVSKTAYRKRSKELDINTLLRDKKFAVQRNGAIGDIIRSIMDNHIDSPVLLSSRDCWSHVIKHIIIRIYLSVLDMSWVRRKYSSLLADQMTSNLKEAVINNKNYSIVYDYLLDKYGFDNVAVDGNIVYFIKVPSYLTLYSDLFYNIEFLHLSNQIVKGGYVMVPSQLIWEYLNKLMFRLSIEDLNRKVGVNVVDDTKTDIDKILNLMRENNLLSTLDKSVYDPTCFPKCVKDQLLKIPTGKNTHNGNFLIATFLYKVLVPDNDASDKDIEIAKKKIMDIYSHSPKYDESKLRYQLDSIVNYSVKSYEQLYSEGVCSSEEYNSMKDQNIYNPLQYYYRCLRRKQKQKGK